MKVWTPIAYYPAECVQTCPDCTTEEEREHPDTGAMFPDESIDHIPACDRCGLYIENVSLTDEGQRWLRDVLIQRKADARSWDELTSSEQQNQAVEDETAQSHGIDPEYPLERYLDDEPEEGPGRYEGETKATRYIESVLLEGPAEEEHSDEAWGWHALFLSLPAAGEPLRAPAYIIHESAETGFVTTTPYDTIDAAREAWTVLMHDIGGEE